MFLILSLFGLGILIAAVLLWKLIVLFFWPLLVLFLIGFLPGMIKFVVKKK